MGAMNPCFNHPPNFPPWNGKLSPPPIGPNARDIEVARRRMGLIALFLLSGLAWAIIFACIGVIICAV